MRQAPTVRTVSATEAKSRFGEMLRRAYAGDEHLIVEKGGIAVVAIIPVSDYQQLLDASTTPSDVAQQVASASQRERANRQLREVLAQAHAHAPEVKEEEAEALILRETMAAKRQRAKKMTATGQSRRTASRRKS